MPERVQQLAALARAALDNSQRRPGSSAADGPDPHAWALVDQLRAEVDRITGPEVGEWVVTRWMVTRETILQCIAAESGAEAAALRAELRAELLGRRGRDQHNRPAGVPGVHHRGL